MTKMAYHKGETELLQDHLKHGKRDGGKRQPQHFVVNLSDFFDESNNAQVMYMKVGVTSYRNKRTLFKYPFLTFTF